MALVVIAVMLVAGVVQTSGRVPSQTSTSRVFVESGQTAWMLAAEHPIPGQTTAQTADEITRLNDLGSGAVPTNVAVKIPTVARQQQTALACR